MIKLNEIMDYSGYKIQLNDHWSDKYDRFIGIPMNPETDNGYPIFGETAENVKAQIDEGK